MDKIAVIIVDYQYDFIDGSLAVKGAEGKIPDILWYLKELPHDYLVFSRDSHPRDHISFASHWNVKPFDTVNGKVVWPDHCVVGTRGQKIHTALSRYVQVADLIVDKGTEQDRDAYSALDGTELAKWLKDRGVTGVIVFGLAFDVCVKATALDASEAGFVVQVLRWLSASVFPENDDVVVDELLDAGVMVV